ncbi:PAS domain-containing sensor histidine kinase [Microlunatus panaciterrae]|uniref:histidine kinase n=1 Tax=Microlunatus panaciterrae TaxID=400768 RepID=A0ABS2REK1_9ACTN|nr:PAS domain-containing sensor histidine kinase [Microlunatus panaciterrae]MBM7797428.1 two-component sensor histidine kinase [Microlunatus panaciterrae]
MPTMSEIVAEHCMLSEEEQSWLKLVVSEWQLLADLSFSDLVLWVQDTDPNVYWAAAQIRPTTGPTALVDDVVGDLIAYSPEHLVSGAFVSGEITRTSDGKLLAGIPVNVSAIPVRHGDRVIAVVERHTSQLGVRMPSSLEQAYLETAGELSEMVATGAFPLPGEYAERYTLGPRVGDGFIRIDADGDVEYASPNALSAYRRLGLTADLQGEHLPTLTAELVPAPDGPVDDSLQSILSGRTARRTEAVSGDAHLLIRTVPLIRRGKRTGAIVLCRDVTDLRNRERELVTKDATIREIHHRVKNNLQTVAALLRMQARRIESPEAKTALQDAMSRVASIAIVHETLSQTFDEVVEFDRVADQLLRMVGDVSAASGAVSACRVGSFGLVSADLATSLSMIVTELCQNAVEHGLANSSGELRVLPAVADGRLRVEVVDNGKGLPDDFSWPSTRSLGLSIVSTLVAELEGTIELGPNPAGPGTRAVLDIPLQRSRGRDLRVER